jgi:hypothetical protein
MKPITMEDKLVNNRYDNTGAFLRLNKDIISKMVLNMTLKGKCPREHHN